MENKKEFEEKKIESLLNPRTSRAEFSTITSPIDIKDAQNWISDYFKKSSPTPVVVQIDPMRNRYFGRLGIKSAPVITKETNVEDIQIKFLTRTDNEVRTNYLMKLKNHKLLQDEPTKKHQTIIIFDWDDTLLCTSFISRQGAVDLPADQIATLQRLDESSRSVEYGETFIITNAAKGWVEYSSKFFLPNLHQTLMKNKIQIISARSAYEEFFPGDFGRWKLETFIDISKKMEKDVIIDISFGERYINIVTNIICLGDSNSEIDAAHTLGKQFSQALIKTIKFREMPRPEELIKQQNLVNEKFDQIYVSIKNLTIRLELKKPQGCTIQISQHKATCNFQK